MTDLRALDQEMARTETDVANAQYAQGWHNSQDESPDRERLSKTFFGKRMLFELTYQNELDWRKYIAGTIFQQSNLTLSTSRRITNQRIARFTKYFFEVRPWWAAVPQNTANAGDKDFARKLLKIADSKLNDSGSAAQFRQAITAACVTGEAILKTTRAVDDDHYRDELNLLIDTAGNPIVASDGDYIEDEDLWMEKPLDPMEAAAAALGTDPSTGATYTPPTFPVLILERDGMTTKQGNEITTNMGTFVHAVTEMRVVERRAVHYQGARTEVVHYRDFLCSPSASSIHTGTICHLYSIEVSELAQVYAANAEADTVRAAVDAIEAAREGVSVSEYPADVDRPRAALGEDITYHRPTTPRLEVGEFYMRCDPDGSGITRDIMVVIEITSQIPIYYNFTAVASPTRRRPFRVIRNSPVAGRWFGQGDMEKFETANRLIDLYLNRAALTQSRAGRVDFFRAQDTKEGDQDPNLKLNWGSTYTPKPNVDATKILTSVYLEDNKSGELRQTLELLNQAVTNESGTASANDSAMAGLDTSNLATGIKNIDASGNELTSLPISELRDGLTKALHDFVSVTFRFHDETETFAYFDGKVPEMLTLSKREVRTLDVNVEILLTKFYGEQQMQQRNIALQAANQYHDYGMTDPWRQEPMTPFYIDMLQQLGVENAQDYIVARQIMGMPMTETGNTAAGPQPSGITAPNAGPPKDTPPTQPKNPTP